MSYHCHRCHTENVKLWRDSAGERLLCGACACTEAGRDYTKLDDDGTMPSQPHGEPDVLIGTYMPALPTSDMLSFWAYSVAPDELVAWWKALPIAMHECRGNDLPVCPYCGHEDDGDDITERTTGITCSACERDYALEVNVSVTYTSRVEMPK